MESRRESLETQFSNLARALDNHLEDEFGDLFQIYPNRLQRGKAANPAYDGLFSTTVPFTLGYGSKYGRGYLVNVDISTFERVDPEQKARIMDDAFRYLEGNLSKFVPGRSLEVVHDGNLMKIIGDFA